MFAVIIIALLIALGVVIWAIARTVIGCAPTWLRIFYAMYVFASSIAAYFTTFRYVYYTNENTRFHGWPVPVVIFQRKNAESPWLDFVGVVTMLAYPINIVLFALLPSIVLLVLSRRSQIPRPDPTQLGN